MSLSIQVGMLADLREREPEGAAVAAFEVSRAAVSTLLESVGLQAHEEPAEFASSQALPFRAELMGVDGLLRLRRIAAYRSADRSVPRTHDDEDPERDPLMQRYYRGRSLLKRIVQGKRAPRLKRRFDHLMHHADDCGWYVPQAFDEVVEGRDAALPGGGLLGSVVSLLRELEELANYLQIPPYLHAASEELFRAAAEPEQGNTVWSRHGIESHTCVVLREGCQHALESGAALVFC